MNDSIVYHSASRDEDIEVDKMESHHLVNAYLKVLKDLAFAKIDDGVIESDVSKWEGMFSSRADINSEPPKEYADKVKLLVQKSVLKAELEKRGLLYLIQ
jgi:hypothetical protein